MSPADPQDLPPWEVERLPEVPQPEHGTTRSQTGMPVLPTHKPFNSFPPAQGDRALLGPRPGMVSPRLPPRPPLPP